MVGRLIMPPQIGIDCTDIEVGAGRGRIIFQLVDFYIKGFLEISQGYFGLIVPASSEKYFL